MSDDSFNQQPITNHEGFERQDLSSRGVFYFMAGLAVVALIIYLIVFGMYRFLDTYEKAHQPAVSPMVTPPADTRAVTAEDTQSFPQPRLEENERNQLRDVIEDQDRKLAVYDWVDKEKGIVKIPIERAMDLIAQRGLPVRPANANAAQTSAPAKQQKPKRRPATTPATATDGN
jgi:hypothetical protein